MLADRFLSAGGVPLQAAWRVIAPIGRRDARAQQTTDKETAEHGQCYLSWSF